MRQPNSQAFLTREQQFNDRFPLSVVAILAIIQMLATFGIIGLEVGHVIIDVRLTNLFAGFWASVPFTILWISMFATVCCCRRRSCATHALIHNCISFLFASALIGINIAFIRHPHECFFTGGLCRSFGFTWYNSVSCAFGSGLDKCTDARMIFIKVQLACGAVMAATCFAYIIAYFIVSSKSARANRQQVRTVADTVMAPVYSQAVFTAPPQSFQPSAPVMMPAYHQAPVQYHNPSYIPPNQYPTIYPEIPQDRF
ncbi:unnamed protein product [Adineta ricciae]|uniref:Uncharacterized protein n=1 Tax=Adineta ricciae TaxID=249248 RepID=A0A814U5H0_ADIRI|nr:unnamed protein product [Adineta ricciae]CAF1170670.1 unnamed protein product [Adineta ricciae]